MKMVVISLTAAAWCFMLASFAIAQRAPATTTPAGVAVLGAPAPATPTTVSAKKPRDPNRPICRTEEIIGSRLGGARTCLTQAQWDQKDAADRDRMNSGQTRAGFLTPH